MTLTLLQGPAGSGKSQLLAALLAATDNQIGLDITALWAAMSGATRGPDGRYSERSDDDPALAGAFYTQHVTTRWALSEGVDVAVTTSRPGQEERWRRLAEEAGVPFQVRTVDPGREVVEARLAGPDGELSEACRRAIDRWYS